ncbi:hypothetical protein GPX89_26020 [Nocardia sp. ET3-3]|uniref:MHYT domain-containing protein n=1 Tax=Nocardia terrae TaxID=2675851 RepID=A0A7K1V238_9NOCA|nr:MHYT domain-containing protein [Nocardia terrae]MVU80696.1 hypothetical protein [Nocardia terrae]
MIIDHFVHGWGIPAVAYIMSVTGSVLALRCVSHARYARRQGGWLIAAAVALGGCGIWVMHFTAMLDFAIRGAIIRFDVPMTLLSALIAVVVVWLGLSIVVRGKKELFALPLGGCVTGLGVAAMHYLGMAAMHTSARIEYNQTLVGWSIAIGVVAATAALWFILHVRGVFATVSSGMIMGVAVCGMHYTGMASMSAQKAQLVTNLAGAQPMDLLLPLILTVTLVTVALMLTVGLAEVEAPTRREAFALKDGPTVSWPTRPPAEQAEQRY